MNPLTLHEAEPQLRPLTQQERDGDQSIVAMMGTARAIHEMRPQMDDTLSNQNIESEMPLPSPLEVATRYPQTPESARTILKGRRQAAEIIQNPSKNSKLLVVVGPCSIHDPESALEYAAELKTMADDYEDELVIIMRTYFEKPRTILGWEGFLEDPHLDKSYDKETGLYEARKLLIGISGEVGLPTATEFLNIETPQFIDDVIAWAAIGARNSESQPHRKMASGLSAPTGLKNGTGGSTDLMLDGIEAASHPHFMNGINKLGMTTRYKTRGNPNVHAIMRGGGGQPNYSEEHTQQLKADMLKRGLNPAIMIDCSHVNSGKDYTRQASVAEDVAQQVANGETAIIGVMIESNLVAGAQKIKPTNELIYGQSVTDECVGLIETKDMLDTLAHSVKDRRKSR